MKSTISRTSPKKAPAKKAARKPFSASKKSASHGSAGRLPKTPSGFTTQHGSLLLVPVPKLKKAPETGIVKASKLQDGLASARKQITGVLQELVDAATDGYEIAEIELSASFNADGKFLGFGVGGDMSIKFKVRPCQ